MDKINQVISLKKSLLPTRVTAIPLWKINKGIDHINALVADIIKQSALSSSIGKLLENNQLVPSMVVNLADIDNLIEEFRNLAKRA